MRCLFWHHIYIPKYPVVSGGNGGFLPFSTFNRSREIRRHPDKARSIRKPIRGHNGRRPPASPRPCPQRSGRCRAACPAATRGVLHDAAYRSRTQEPSAGRADQQAGRRARPLYRGDAERIEAVALEVIHGRAQKGMPACSAQHHHVPFGCG